MLKHVLAGSAIGNALSCARLQVMHGLCLQHLLLDEGGNGGDGMEGCDDTGLWDTSASLPGWGQPPH